MQFYVKPLFSSTVHLPAWVGPSHSPRDPFTGGAHQSQVTGTTAFPGLLNYSKFTGAVYAFCILMYYVIRIPHLFAK